MRAIRAPQEKKETSDGKGDKMTREELKKIKRIVNTLIKISHKLNQIDGCQDFKKDLYQFSFILDDYAEDVFKNGRPPQLRVVK